MDFWLKNRLEVLFLNPEFHYLHSEEDTEEDKTNILQFPDS